MSDEPKHTTNAAFVAIWNNNSLLILARYKWLSEGTPWQLPGGGEEFSDKGLSIITAQREVEEEIGYEIDISRLVYFSQYQTKWSEEIRVFEYDTEIAPFIDREKFFGFLWLPLAETTENKQQLISMWRLFMPGLQKYLVDRVAWVAQLKSEVPVF